MGVECHNHVGFVNDDVHARKVTEVMAAEAQLRVHLLPRDSYVRRADKRAGKSDKFGRAWLNCRQNRQIWPSLATLTSTSLTLLAFNWNKYMYTVINVKAVQAQLRIHHFPRQLLLKNGFVAIFFHASCTAPVLLPALACAGLLLQFCLEKYKLLRFTRMPQHSSRRVSLAVTGVLLPLAAIMQPIVRLVVWWHEHHDFSARDIWPLVACLCLMLFRWAQLCWRFMMEFSRPSVSGGELRGALSYREAWERTILDVEK
eukprot:g67246.t1